MKIKIYKAPMVLSKGINPELIQKQFIFRNTGKYDGESELGIAEMEEPIWWNRPLKSDVLVKKEADGLYSYNFPLAWRAEWKTAYNVLLNKYNVPVTAMIKINPNWDNAQRDAVINSFVNCTYNTLLKLGVKEEHLQKRGNDIMYDYKKFFGLEFVEKNGWYSISCFITLRYTPEKPIFDRLTGEFAQQKKITGIIEETELFTKEEFIDALMKAFKEFFETIE